MSVTRLESLTGGRCRLWHFTSSHNRMTLRVMLEDGSEHDLVLSFCRRVKLPGAWTVQHLTITSVPPNWIYLQDNDVLIECQEVAYQSAVDDTVEIILTTAGHASEKIDRGPEGGS